MSGIFIRSLAEAIGGRLSRRTFLAGSAVAALASGTRAQAGIGCDDLQTRRAPRLWYEQPAQAWEEALPVGNGRMGAMVFGGVGTERLQLNEDTLWSGGPYDPVNPQARAALPEARQLIAQGHYARAEELADERLMARPLSQMAYQVLGDLSLSMPGFTEPDTGSYYRELDLDAAMASTHFTVDGARYRRDVVASPDAQVIAIRLAADRPASITCDIALTSPHDTAVTAAGASLLLTGRNGAAHDIDGALTFAARARVLAEGGTMRAGDGVLRVEGTDSFTILVAMATSYRRFDDVSGDPRAITEARIAAAAPVGFERLARDASIAHRRLFRRVEIDLGQTPAAERPTDERIRLSQDARDPDLAALYFQYGRYLLISSSRPGSQPANLQGIWNDSVNPPWGSKYTININTEMNYWPAHSTGLSECVEPLVEMIRDLAETGARTAHDMYGARGWVAHHNTDLWRATAPIDGARWGLWPTGGAWLCTHLWEFYDYERDLAFLRSVYPLMRGATLFFLDTLQIDSATGSLVTNPSISPENPHPGGASVCAGPAMDQQILRDLFAQTAAAAGLLGIEPDFARQLRETRARLAPDQIGAQGQLQEWQADWDGAAPEPDHRHVSHLYALFPSHQINPDETPALAQAARRSLEMRGDQSTGWATAWRIALWTRLRDAERAHRILRFLLGPGRTYPNMFDAHPPFQIDGNFGGTAAIAEMLVQSRGDEIMLLPALPSAWPEGSVRGLRTRGACRIDLAWREGALTEATLVGRLAGERTVRLGERGVTVRLEPGRPVRLRGPSLLS